MIEVVNEESDPPETHIRESLDKVEFSKIVNTWAEELELEQLCTEDVLGQIFVEFDRDCDGKISERDLREQISSLITKNASLRKMVS